MLVVSLKPNEKICLPGINAVITLVETQLGKSRIGIDAPKEILVLREKLMTPEIVMGEYLAAKHQLVAETTLSHALRNKINTGVTGLALLRRQMEMNVGTEAIMKTVERLTKGLAIVEEPVTVVQPHQFRALLVEDDENERELMAGLLRISGIEVESVDDGDDALIYLRDHQHPDVILLDMNMPRMNGCDFVRKVRDDFPESRSKIFMVTGGDTPQRVPPVDRWIRKPVDPVSLLKEIGSLCNAS